MTKWKTLIVDDERPARSSLRVLLEREPDLEIVGECETGGEAVEALIELRPDLLFLDIQMPGGNGFEVLERVDPALWPRVVFVTAFDEYAVRAFDVNAVDYLLKPFDEDRLGVALSRVRENLRSPAEDPAERIASSLEERERRSGASARRIVVRETGRIRFVEVSEIRWISGAGNLVELHLGDEVVLHRESLQSLEERLDPALFLRIHRSTIVRVDEIEELRPLSKGDYEVELKDGEVLKLSRSHQANLKRIL